jgi:zinc protease
MTPSPEGPDAPLPERSDVVVRHLANGLGVWTWKAPTLSGELAVGLHVAAGSLCEAEEERGLSHLLEHLAFVGGTHFPPGSLGRFFDRHGTRLGRHHNATTGFEQTSFALSFPENAHDTLDRSIACLADFAFGIELSDAAVEQERRVVLEEVRGHEGASSRIRDRVLELVLPGSLVARRHPLGAPEVIRDVTSQELQTYYRRWYRPDTCTIVAAGEVTEQEVEEAVERYFGDWSAEGPPPPAPDPGVRSVAQGACEVVTDPDTIEASARLVTARRWRPPRTRSQLFDRSLQEAALWLLGRRLGELVFDKPHLVRDVRIGRSKLAQSWHLIDATASTSFKGVVEAAEILARELHRIEEYGFGEPEVESAAEFLRASARQTVRRQAHRPVRALVQELLGAVNSGGPPPSAELRSEALSDLAERLDPAVIRESVTSTLGPADVSAAVVLPSHTAVRPSSRELRDAMRRASSAPRSAPVYHPRPHRLLDRPPSPGEVKERAEDSDLGVHSLTLANGVMIHLLPMEERVDRILVQLTLTGGRIRETPADLGLTAGAALAFSSPAADGVPSRVIRDRLAESTVVLRCTVDEDCITLRLSADPEDIEDGLQLLHLLLSRPRVEPGALQRWQAAFEGYSADRPRPLEAQLAQNSMRLLSGDDHRFQLLTHERVAAITVDTAQRWLERELCAAPLEAAVVGAIDRDHIAEQVLRYRGGSLDELRELPERCRRRTSDQIHRAVADSVRPERRLTVVCRPSA